MTRHYRATARGRFGTLSEQQREHLVQEQHLHSVLGSRFGPNGAFLYESSLVNFQYRCELTIADESSPADADALAELLLEERATGELRTRGLPFAHLSLTVECVQDMRMRIRR